MDDIASALKPAARPKAKISAEEIERRREIIRRGDAHNRIEGIYRDPATDAIFEAFIRGDIEARDIVPRLNAQLGPR
jgi:Antitoxin VbhA